MSLQAETLHAEQRYYWGHMQFHKLMNGKQEINNGILFLHQNY